MVSVGLKSVREEVAGAVLIEPMEFGFPAHENPAENETHDALGVVLCVNERKRGAPRTAEHVPFLESKVDPQRLQIAY